MRSLFVGLVSLSLGILPIGCRSEEPAPDFADPDLVVRETNPDGVPYPTDNLGGRPRRTSARGERIPNFAFQGYRDGDRSGGLETISLSEYYDPAQKRHKVLHLLAAATWCAICSSELEAAVSAKEPLAAEGVVFFEVIVSGAAPGKGPSLAEVDEWVSRHKANFSVGIDVRARRLGTVGVDPAAMPHDILIDTRTMEILDSSVGAPLDIVKYVREGLRWVKENPPSY